MFQNTVLLRELLRFGRSLRLYFLRGLLPLATGSLIVGYFLKRDPQAGIHAFEWLAFLFNLFTLLAMPLLVSGVLYEEWHANTLSVLVLTETRLGAVLQGLLSSRVILVLANLFACFPVLISIMMFGGITAAQLVQFSTLMLSLTVFYGAFSLWATCVIPGREKSLGFLFLTLVLPQGIAFFLVKQAGAAREGLLSWVPAIAMYRLTQDVLPWSWFSGVEMGGGAQRALLTGAMPPSAAAGGDWLSMNVCCLLLAALFFLLSRRRLSHALGEGPAKGPVEVSTARRSTGPIVGNPLSWLVLRRFDPLFGLPRRLVVLLAIAVNVALVLQDSWTGAVLLVRAAGYLGVAIMVWTFLWACLVSAQTWMEERTQRTLELILATPYTLDEIILWKVDALFWALLAPTVIYSLFISNLLFAGNPVAPLMRLFLLIPFTICCFLYSYVGLLIMVYLTIFFAIKATSTVQAVLLTLGFLAGLLLVNLFLILLADVGGALLVCIIDAAFLFGFIPLFRSRLRSFEPT